MRTTLVLFLLMQFFPAIQGFASGYLPPSSSAQQAFIRDLESRKDYYRAITETYRYHFMYPGQSGPPLELELARLYMAGGNYPMSRNKWYLCLTDRSLSADLKSEIRLGLARSYELEGSWNNSLIEYMQCRSGTVSGIFAGIDPVAKRIEMNIRLFRFKEAAELLDLSMPSGVEKDFLRSKLDEARRLPFKSEIAADFLSVIPGMNLIYLGKVREGLTRFLVQAGAGALIWYSFSRYRNDYVTGAAVSFTVVSWVIYNFSMNSGEVQRYNAGVERRFQESFRP